MGEVYKYGAKLEIASPRFQQRAEFITYILFICLVILVSWRGFHLF
jgi:Derlin-2/3